MRSYWLFSLFTVWILSSLTPVQALQIWPIKGDHWASVGPEAYHVRRERAGGTVQSGTLAGYRASYDRYRPMSLYWGVDQHWATGRVTGHSGSGKRLSSTMSELDVEGRFGFNLCLKCFSRFSLIPIIGAGYFREELRFPVLKMRTNLTYFMGGVYSRYSIFPCFTCGLDFKAKSTLDGWHKILDPSADEPITLLFDYEMLYTIDLPITYANHWRCVNYAIAFIPFYRTRHYGGREGFPFDFIDTHVRLYGARLMGSLIF